MLEHPQETLIDACDKLFPRSLSRCRWAKEDRKGQQMYVGAEVSALSRERLRGPPVQMGISSKPHILPYPYDPCAGVVFYQKVTDNETDSSTESSLGQLAQ